MLGKRRFDGRDGHSGLPASTACRHAGASGWAWAAPSAPTPSPPGRLGPFEGHGKTTQFVDSGAYAPQVVVIMLGTNDSKKSNWSAHGQDYKRDSLAMVRRYQNLGSHPQVFVMTSPPNYTNGSRYQPSVIKNQIVPIVRQVSQETGAVLIDIFTPLSGHPELFPDGTHPSTTASKRIAALVKKAILANR